MKKSPDLVKMEASKIKTGSCMNRFFDEKRQRDVIVKAKPH